MVEGAVVATGGAPLLAAAEAILPAVVDVRRRLRPGPEPTMALGVALYAAAALEFLGRTD